MPLFMNSFRDALHSRFLLRWVLANVIGWTVGLYAGFLNPICFGGAGIIAGLVLGTAQRWALQDTAALGEQPARIWITRTFAGAAVGLMPAVVLGGALFLFANQLAVVLAGGILGAAVGIGQWMVLRSISTRAALWIGANVVGGAACGLLAGLPIIRGLPLGLLAGAMLFGYLTGRVLGVMLREKPPTQGWRFDDEPKQIT